MKISIVVPVYNGERTLPELFRRIERSLNGLDSWEVIFVHDCGRDNSLETIDRLERENPARVRGFRMDKNMGQHNALLFGISKAAGDFIVTLDEDLQHDPALIPSLLEKQKEGDFDVVYARFRKLEHPGMRIRMSETLRVVLPKIIPGLYPGYSPYRLIKSRIAKQILALNYSYSFIDGYLSMVTSNFGSIDAVHHKRADGKSSYSYYKLFRHGIMIGVYYSPRMKWLNPFFNYRKKRS